MDEEAEGPFKMHGQSLSFLTMCLLEENGLKRALVILCMYSDLMRINLLGCSDGRFRLQFTTFWARLPPKMVLADGNCYTGWPLENFSPLLSLVQLKLYKQLTQVPRSFVLIIC